MAQDQLCPPGAAAAGDRTVGRARGTRARQQVTSVHPPLTVLS
jgi:hypothetical protein